MHLDFQTLETMLGRLNSTFKQLARVSVYANGASILAKTEDELHRLKKFKLHTLYMGLESGDNENDAVAETQKLIQGLELEQTVFRADHSSNIIPLEGRFPKDKNRLLTQLDALPRSGHLDTKSPGRLPWSMWFRINRNLQDARR
ncbi:MAG: hypothetical protein MUC65_03500 [Pontiellaceae bacterium]|jgi:hypothetical protein|nr:hypothetical protein [Pontiellaceae bacterium]